MQRERRDPTVRLRRNSPDEQVDPEEDLLTSLTRLAAASASAVGGGGRALGKVGRRKKSPFFASRLFNFFSTLTLAFASFCELDVPIFVSTSQRAMSLAPAAGAAHGDGRTAPVPSPAAPQLTGGGPQVGGPVFLKPPEPAQTRRHSSPLVVVVEEPPPDDGHDDDRQDFTGHCAADENERRMAKWDAHSPRGVSPAHLEQQHQEEVVLGGLSPVNVGNEDFVRSPNIQLKGDHSCVPRALQHHAHSRRQSAVVICNPTSPSVAPTRRRAASLRPVESSTSFEVGGWRSPPLPHTHAHTILTSSSSPASMSLSSSVARVRTENHPQCPQFPTFRLLEDRVYPFLPPSSTLDVYDGIT